MSDDATAVIRENGRDTYWYRRRGGSYIDSELLMGPEATLDFVRQQRPMPEPFLEGWLSGLLLIDVDRRVVRWWSGHCVGRGSRPRRAEPERCDSSRRQAKRGAFRAGYAWINLADTDNQWETG